MPFSAENSDAEPLGSPEPIELDGVVLRPGATVGPYRYERLIGRGGMALVLLVRDPSGNRVALKLMHGNRSSNALARFRREFRALARLRHPAVIRVEAYGNFHEHPYIAMEYADGPDLYQSLRKFKDMPPEQRWRRVEVVLADICQALTYIHRRGLVHRDLKPSNVLQTADGRCKLTDFGIVKDLEELADPDRKTRVGTWAYCAPEQIAGQTVDARADLYSLGVILYTMLAGRRPFSAEDMAGYLTAHRDQVPTLPSRYEPTVPRKLQDICMRLLAKAPRDRFQSAVEILYLLEKIDPLDQARSTPDEVAWELPLVGRDEELATAREALDVLAIGLGSVVLLEGAEGVGKTRLLRTALDQARLRGFPVHTWRVAPQDGSYATMLQIASELARELGDQTPPQLISSIRTFFAAKGELSGDARYQLYDAVRDGLAQLLASGPRVLAIDDLHLAPPPLLALLAYVVRAVLARDRLPLLLLATARPSAEVRASGDEEPASAVAAFLDGANLGVVPVMVPVGALKASEVGQVVASLLGTGEAALALTGRLQEETAGNPLFLVEFVRSLRQRGLLVPGPGGRLSLATDTTEIATGHLEVPPGVRQVVQRRIESLDPDERAVLEVLAVSDRELELEVLLEALAEPDPLDRAEAGLFEEAWLDRIDRLVEAGILAERRRLGLTRYDFVHRKVGDVVYRDLPPARRAGLHRRLAMTLESRAPDSPMLAESVGEHYRRAGEPGLAYRLLVRASVHLWERSFSVESWELAQRAAALEEQAEVELVSDSFHASRRELLRVRADALFNRGLWEEARVARERLIVEAEAASDLRLRDVARLGLGVLQRRLGRHAEGEALMRTVLADARARADRETVLDALRNLSAIAWDKGDLDETERLASEGLVSATGSDHSAGRAHMLLALATVQAARGQLAAATAGLGEAEGILKRLRLKRTLCVAACNLAEILVWQGELGPAIARATEALALAEEVLFKMGEAYACRVRALALLDAGDLDGASRDIEHALRICEDLDLAEDRVATRALAGRLALLRDQPGRAVDHLQAGLAASRTWDPEGYGPLLQTLLAVALHRVGEQAEAQSHLETVAARTGDLRPVRRAQVLLGLAVAQAGAGQVDRARRFAKEAALQARARGLQVAAMEAMSLLAVLEGEEEHRQAARAEAEGIATEIAATLPEDLVEGFVGRAGVGRG